MLIYHHILVLIGCVTSMCLFIASTSANEWVISTAGSQSTNNSRKNSDLKCYGLWIYCLESGECREIGSEVWAHTKWMHIPNWLQAVRIFACMSAAVEAFACLKTVINMLKGKTELKESKYALMAGPFLMLIALTIFTSFEDPAPEQHYTWG